MYISQLYIPRIPPVVYTLTSYSLTKITQLLLPRNSSGSPHCQPPRSCRLHISPSLSPKTVAAGRQSPTMYDPGPWLPMPFVRVCVCVCVSVSVCVCMCVYCVSAPERGGDRSPANAVAGQRSRPMARPPTALPVSRSRLSLATILARPAVVPDCQPTPLPSLMSLDLPCNYYCCGPCSSPPLRCSACLSPSPTLQPVCRPAECPNMSNDC